MTQNPKHSRGGGTDRGLGRFEPTADGGQPFLAPTRTPRLLLSDREPGARDVDGVWWPRTDNLTAELHDLVSALTTRLGETTRISFDWNRLSRSQRNIDAPDGIDVTGALPDQPPQVMYVSGPHDRRLRLLVIDPDTSTDRAHEQMRSAVGAAADRL